MPATGSVNGCYVLGVDPGVNGGLALLDAAGSVCGVLKLACSDWELLNWLRSWRVTLIETNVAAFAMLEKTYAGPRMSKMTARTFGEQVGRIKFALFATGWNTVEVMPAIWQRALRCQTGGDKNVTKRRALGMFSRRRKCKGLAVTHAIADALLLAEFGRTKIGREMVCQSVRQDAGQGRKLRGMGRKASRPRRARARARARVEVG